MRTPIILAPQHLGPALLLLGLSAGCGPAPDAGEPTTQTEGADSADPSSGTQTSAGTSGGPGNADDPSGPDDTGEPPADGSSSGASASSGTDADQTTDTGEPSGGLGELFWLVDAESGAPQPLGTRHDGIEAQICEAFEDEALSFMEQPDAYGDRALRLIMRERWPWGNGNACSSKLRGLLMERESVQMAQGETTWIGWAVYVPADWTERSNGTVTSLNVHGIPGTPPQIRVNLRDDEWEFKGRGNLDIDTETWALEVGQWHELVMEASFDKSNDGYVKLWHKLRTEDEWTQRADFVGQTASDSAEFPFHIRFGFDIPSGEWGNASPERILYYDEVRVGRPTSSFDEVKPGSGFYPPDD